MKDEIKEILDYLEKYMSIDDCIRLSKIEDYITNLQEQLHQASLDIQELTEKDIGCPSWCDKLTNLQEKVNMYENPDDMTLFYMWLDEKAKDKMKQLQKENERLKEKYELKQKLEKVENDRLKCLIEKGE